MKQSKLILSASAQGSYASSSTASTVLQTSYAREEDPGVPVTICTRSKLGAVASPEEVPVDSPERKVLEAEEKKGNVVGKKSSYVSVKINGDTERRTEHPHGERKVMFLW